MCRYDNSTVTVSNMHFMGPGDDAYTPPTIGHRELVEGARRLSLDPRDWGPAAWDFLFAVSRSYSAAPTALDRSSMRRFLVSLQYALPCEGCREHFAESLAQLSPSDLDGPNELADWFENLRERIALRRELRDDADEPSKTGKRADESNKPSKTGKRADESNKPSKTGSKAGNTAEGYRTCRACSSG